MNKEKLLYFLTKIHEYLQFSNEKELKEYFFQDFLKHDGHDSLKVKAFRYASSILMSSTIKENIMKQNAVYLEYYHEVLGKTVVLGRELNMMDSLSFCILYITLLWGGFLSYNGVHKYCPPSFEFSIPELYGFNVFSGEGVCRNYSAMLSDLLESGGFNSAILTNEVIQNPERSIFVRSIERLLKPNNHMVNLIQGENGFYLFDSTFRTPANIINTEKAVSIVEKATYHFNLLESYQITLEAKRRTLLERFMLNQDMFVTLDKEDCLLKCKLYNEKLKENIALLRDYYQEILPLLVKTVEGLHLVRKR